MVSSNGSGAPDLGALSELDRLLRGKRTVVLAGAGCSTESGIPDYRGPEGIRRNRQPMQYQEFMRSERARIRYWARSTIGWPRFRSARPNPGHHALAALEEGGLVPGVITQNVDGLHQAAGSRRVVELHGSLSVVRCLGCGTSLSREGYQARLLELNPGWLDSLGAASAELAPDGDAELPVWAESGFRIAPCPECGGVLKPDVVFFGENVPRERVEEAWALFAEAEVLLVVGSSLAVYSGRRFIYRADDEGIPIAIINQGPTRADEFAEVKIEGRVGTILPGLAKRLLGR